jgi:magnesium and cobalt transporter
MSTDSSIKSWLTRLSHSLSRPKNQQELLEILSEAADEHLLEASAFKMIEGVLKVYQRQVRDIMIPRSEMVVIDANSSLAEILPILISSAHSRFPVIQGNKDEVLGVLLAKDLLRYTSGKDQTFSLSTLLRPATFIPETKRLHVLLEEFRLKRNHLAIVVDEYGGVSGMLTIEDVLEEIVGEIEDEYDVAETHTNITSIDDQTYQVKALTTIEEFNVFFHTHFSNEDFDTVGGLVIMHFGYFPTRDETITIEGIPFKILQTDKRKIRLLQVSKPMRST